MNKQLNDEWVIYFHDYMDSNWNRESYEKLVHIKTIYDFWTVFDIIKDKLTLGMFFFMKNNIFPKWDDKQNCKLSFVSIKILKSNTINFMEETLIHLMSGNLLPNNAHHIHGISISPKKGFCIIKI